MVSPTPHNKFILILASDSQISSLNFFTGYFYSKLSVFGRKVCVQCYAENFEVHDFVFLISDLVSMNNFTVEKVFFKNKILHFKFHTICPPNVSQILNAVLTATSDHKAV